MDQMKMLMIMLKNQNSINSINSAFNKPENAMANQFNDSTSTLIQTTKDHKAKICLVCGDLAKSNHFGSLCCCSCKAFFRRSVQNESYKNFHCPYNSNCEITIVSRKCCQFCRFEKCVKIGMEIGWVMTEEERLQLLKSRMLKKQKTEQEEAIQMSKTSCSSKDSFIDSSSQNSDNNEIYFADYDLINNYLTNNEVNEIENLVNAYLTSCIQIQPQFIKCDLFTKQSKNEARLAQNDEEIIELFLNCVYQFVDFTKKLDFFKRLNLADQQILLRSSIIELCFLRAAFCFDQNMFYRTVLSKKNYLNSNKNQSISNQNSNLNSIQNSIQNNVNFNQNKENFTYDSYQFIKVPVLEQERLDRFFLNEQLSNKFFNFIKQVHECNLDESMAILLSLIVLLNPERYHLINCKHITNEQEFYLNLLERYMQWKFGQPLSGTLFAKLLMTLPNLRELAENFAEFQLKNNVLERFSCFDETVRSECSNKSENVRILSRIFTIKSLSD